MSIFIFKWKQNLFDKEATKRRRYGSLADNTESVTRLIRLISRQFLTSLSSSSSPQAKHNKKYSDAGEEKLRYKIYLENRHKIAKHNTRYNQKNVSYDLGLNKYADMLHSEFVRTLNGFNRSRDHENSVYRSFAKVEEPVSFIGAANVQLPTAVDWRDKGAVTDIKDQGHCGKFDFPYR